MQKIIYILIAINRLNRKNYSNKNKFENINIVYNTNVKDFKTHLSFKFDE